MIRCAINELYIIKLGKYCPKVVHGEDGPFLGCPLAESCETGRSVEKEMFDQRLNLWMSSAVYPTDLVTEENLQIFVHMVHDISARKNAELELRNTITKLREITEAGIKAMTRIVEQRDSYTAGHQAQVSQIANTLAVYMGLDKQTTNSIRIAGMLHDIGKISVPIEILTKPGKISEDEFNIIRKHPVVGYDILKDIDFEWPIARMVLEHHERLDGSGYPKGLFKDEISLGARIISVADVFEAMTSHRPYRPGLSVQSALDELTQNKGTRYDTDVVDAFVYLQSKRGIFVI